MKRRLLLLSSISISIHLSSVVPLHAWLPPAPVPPGLPGLSLRGEPQPWETASRCGSPTRQRVRGAPGSYPPALSRRAKTKDWDVPWSPDDAPSSSSSSFFPRVRQSPSTSPSDPSNDPRVSLLQSLKRFPKPGNATLVRGRGSSDNKFWLNLVADSTRGIQRFTDSASRNTTQTVATESNNKPSLWRSLFTKSKNATEPKDRTPTAKSRTKDRAPTSSPTRQTRTHEPPKTRDDAATNASPWPVSILSRVQSAATSLFVNAPSNTTTDTPRSSNTTTTSSNPLSTLQKFWSSSYSTILSSVPIKPEEQWITVLPKTRLMPGVIVPVTVAGLDLLVVASQDGRRLYAIENSCPHLGTPLETGQLVRLPVEETTRTTVSTGTPKPVTSAITTSTNEPSFSSQLRGVVNGPWSEKDVSRLLQQDGCEDCIVCPLHRTAFALQSGAVRGEWCPFPPVLGKLMGNVKAPTSVAVFDIRTRGKNVQIRINTPIVLEDDEDKSSGKP